MKPMSLLQGRGTSQVRLSLPPAFATCLLARHIPNLTRRFPGLKLHLSASVDPVGFKSVTFDLAVQHFDDKDDTFVSSCCVMRRESIETGYRERLQLVEMNDMAGSTLLYTTSHANWSRWLAKSGCPSTHDE